MHEERAPSLPFSAVVRSVEVATTASIPSQSLAPPNARAWPRPSDLIRPPATPAVVVAAAVKAGGGDVKSVKTRLPADYELCSGCHHAVRLRSVGRPTSSGDLLDLDGLRAGVEHVLEWEGWMDSEKNISKMKALRGLLQMHFCMAPCPR